MSSRLSSSFLLDLDSGSAAFTSISVALSGSLLDADTFFVGSEDCFSDEALEDADVGTGGMASVWADEDTSGETSVDAELPTCRETTADVCVVDTVWAGAAAVAATAATDAGVAVVVDTWVVVTFVVATVMDFSGDGVVGTGAPVEVLTGGGGILTVFSAVVAGVVEVVHSLEGAAAATTGVIPGTPSALSVGEDEVTVTVFASAVVVTLADVVVGEGVQVGVGVAAGFVEDVETAGTVSCACVAT